MKPGRRILVLSGLLIALTTVAARADGFELPDLNPFDGKAKDRSSRSEPAEANRGLGLPTLPKVSLPKMNLAPARKTTVSTWQRMQKGTEQFFSALNPWSGTTKTSRDRRRTGNQSAFSWLFPSKKEREEINTVNDFLSLPRPDYD